LQKLLSVIDVSSIGSISMCVYIIRPKSCVNRLR
jgi:hypothetical protein